MICSYIFHIHFIIIKKAIGIGTGTLAKMSKGEYVAMEVLDKICTYLQCNIEDVIKHQP